MVPYFYSIANSSVPSKTQGKNGTSLKEILLISKIHRPKPLGIL